MGMFRAISIIMFFVCCVAFSQQRVVDKNGLIDPKKARKDKDAVSVPDATIDPKKQQKEFFKQMEKNKEQIEASTEEFAKKKYRIRKGKASGKKDKDKEKARAKGKEPAFQKPRLPQ